MRPPGASVMIGMNGAPMPIKFAEAVRKLPHVSIVSPVNAKFVTEGKIEIIYGIDFHPSMRSSLSNSSPAARFKGPDDVIIDDIFAGSGSGYHVGDSITMQNHPFRISGIVEHGKGARKMIPIDTMGKLTDAEGKSSMFYIKCDDPANDNTVIQEIHATRRP